MQFSDALIEAFNAPFPIVPMMTIPMIERPS